MVKKKEKSSLKIAGKGEQEKKIPHFVKGEVIKIDRNGWIFARPTESVLPSHALICVKHYPLKKLRKVKRYDCFLFKILPNKLTKNVQNSLLDKGLKNPKLIYEGQILTRILKNTKNGIGILYKEEGTGFFVKMLQGSGGDIFISDQNAQGFLEKDLVEISFLKKSQQRIESGKIIRKLGHITQDTNFSLLTLISNDIPYQFTQETLEEADALSPADMANREDWCMLPFVTIDPKDAKDRDDAVYAIADQDPTNEGGYVLYVAISDVAYFVRYGTSLDEEAYKRSNSVYLPDRTVPMLPEAVSNGLCSLQEAEPRAALAVKIRFNAYGERIECSFHRAMIRCIANLSYEQAQDAINGTVDNKTKTLVEDVLKPLWQNYFLLQKQEKHALELDVAERKIILNENKKFHAVLSPKRLDAHRLIESFMIQANICAAQLLKEKKQSLLYRIHDRPSLSREETLRSFLKTIGFNFPKIKNYFAKDFNKILRSASNTDKKELIHQTVLRAQSQAEYHCENIGHFGLNLTDYAHFTSPIRRYADLIIHRALIKILQLGAGGLKRQEEERLDEIALQISQHERRAQKAEREANDRFIAQYLSEKLGMDFKARITGVTKSGLFVGLIEYGIDGFIPIAQLKDDYYIFDEVHQAFIARHSRLAYQISDEVDVRLKDVEIYSARIFLEMLSPAKRKISSFLSFNKKNSLKKIRK